MTATVLVFNAGSSSLKFQLLQPESGTAMARGIVERIGQPNATARIDSGGRTSAWTGPVPDYDTALTVMRELFNHVERPLEAEQLQAIGHRVVHGGAEFVKPTLITSQVLQTIWNLVALAPLHNPANAGVIESALDTFAAIPQVAVFDTAFFGDLPSVAATYAIDRDVARQHHIRRYGFHGISHEYVSRTAANVIGRENATLKQVVLHLGNGASAAAIDGGRAIDTSMGLTPLEGLVMGTRGGDIDPGVLIHLQRSAGMGPDDLEELFNRRSGMKGLAGTADMRDVHRLIAAGDTDAAQALDVYCYRARKYIGAYFAALGGLDTLVFTAGVGENDATVRAQIAGGLDSFGIAIDPDRNTVPTRGPRVISPDGASVIVLVIPTNEELAIARQTVALIGSTEA